MTLSRVVFAVLLGLSSAVLAHGSDRGIFVSGSGVAYGEPDVATADVGVNVRHERLDDAMDEATRTMERIIDALRAHEVAERDIRTISFQVHREERTDREGRQVSVHYRVTNVVRVTMRDFERIGAILAAAVDAGANTVHSIHFAISDTDALLRQARERAVLDARDKAEQLAALSGVELGPPARISERVHEPSPVAFGARALMAEAAFDAVPIEGGELAVVVAVEVLFDID